MLPSLTRRRARCGALDLRPDETGRDESGTSGEGGGRLPPLWRRKGCFKHADVTLSAANYAAAADSISSAEAPEGTEETL